MKLRCCLLIITFTTCTLSIYAQQSDTVNTKVMRETLQLLTGVTVGRNVWAEVGIAKNISETQGHHPFSVTVFGSSEMKLNNQFVCGPKVGVWAAGGFAAMVMGVNMIYYTDFHHGTPVVRPEIGFGLKYFKLVYGYNIRVAKNRIDRLDHSVGSLVFGIGVKKLREYKVE